MSPWRHERGSQGETETGRGVGREGRYEFGHLWVQGQGRKNFVRNRTTQAVVLNLGYTFRIFS